MFTLLKALYVDYVSNPRYNVLLLGLEQTGKSKFGSKIKNKEDETQSTYLYRPTVGFNVIKCRTANGIINLWDLGGKKGLRKIWEHYYQQCHGIIFFMDHRVQEGFSCLLNVLLHPDMVSIPLLILTTSVEYKQNIEKQLQSLSSNEAFHRKIIVEIIPQQKSKNCQFQYQKEADFEQFLLQNTLVALINKKELMIYQSYFVHSNDDCFKINRSCSFFQYFIDLHHQAWIF